jgi:molybdate transport system substrate-binding protein
VSSLNILSGGAAQGLVGSLTPAFKAHTGFDIAGEFGAVGIMADKLRKGTLADIVILTAALLAKLAEEKLIVAATIYDVGLVETALAVRTGDPQATVRDATDLREALLASDAIYVPDTKTSTAGIHVANVLQQLGRPIGCTQSTEIISTKGVTLSGSLPPGCELATMYTAGITTAAAHPQQAQDLIDLLTGAAQHEQRKRAGFISGRSQAPT